MGAPPVNRQVVTTNFGEGLLRHTVRIQHGFESPDEGQESYAALVRFMQDLCYQPEVLRHIGAAPMSVRFFHEGGNWVVESITVSPRPRTEE